LAKLANDHRILLFWRKLATGWGGGGGSGINTFTAIPSARWERKESVMNKKKGRGGGKRRKYGTKKEIKTDGREGRQYKN
jgi:hypothetical protein